MPSKRIAAVTDQIVAVADDHHETFMNVHLSDMQKRWWVLKLTEILEPLDSPSLNNDTDRSAEPTGVTRHEGMDHTARPY
jgi:hypothetical protein